jgi:hypothetical protein
MWMSVSPCAEALAEAEAAAEAAAEAESGGEGGGGGGGGGAGAAPTTVTESRAKRDRKPTTPYRPPSPAGHSYYTPDTTIIDPQYSHNRPIIDP